MTSFAFSVHGSYDPVDGQLLLKLNIPELVNQGSFTPLFQQQNRESQEVVVLQKTPFIRKPSLHFCSSALGVMGGVGLIASCFLSILLPAIASIGVIGIAYLAKRKIVSLNVKELSLEDTTVQNIFKNKVDSAVNTNHAQPILNHPIPEIVIEDVQKPSNPLPPPPPPPPPPPSSSKEFPAGSESPYQQGDTDSPKDVKMDPRNALLKSIRERGNKFNIKNTEKTLEGDSKIYPSNLLLKELKSTYERAQNMSETGTLKGWEGHFAKKVENFEKNFGIIDQTQTSEYPSMEGICEKAKTLDSLLENMKWIKSLLHVLSNRKDLTDTVRNYCSKKLESLDKRIEDLERSHKKKISKAEKKESNAGNIERNTLNITEILIRGSENFSSNNNSIEETGKNSSEEKTTEQILKERYFAIHGKDDSASDPETDTDEWND